jgi:hypothetical protein
VQIVLVRLVEEPDVALVAGGVDPVETIALTAHVARAVYEGESNDLGLLRTVSGFWPAFRKIEEEFERARYRMQKERLRRLFDAGRASKGIGFDEARHILRMYTSREIHRVLVIEDGWSPDRHQEWLSQTLATALVEA